MAKAINKLDDSTIRALRLEQGKTQSKHSDGDNLFVRVTHTGKRFELRYYFNDKERLLVLGQYPALSLAQARKDAKAVRDKVSQGIDPIADRERNRAAEAANKAVKQAQQAIDSNTFKLIALEWFDRVVKQECKPSHARVVQLRLNNYLFPKLGHLPITTIRNADVRKVLEAIGNKGHDETAKRVRIIAGQVFRYAINTDRAEHDPTAALRDVLKAPRATHFAAPIEPKELAPILKAIKSYDTNRIAAALTSLTPYLLVRPGELRTMQWSQIDWETNEWRFNTSKTDTDHVVPLASQVIDQLKALQRLTGSSVWVFPSVRDFSKCAHENTVINVLRSIGINQNQATAHGFRATARTILDEVLNQPVDLIEHQLAHKVKDPLGRAYNRTKHLPARHTMMQLWADYLDGLANDSNVVPLGKAKLTA
jgi:integrase